MDEVERGLGEAAGSCSGLGLADFRGEGSGAGADLPVCLSIVATNRPEVKESPAPFVLIRVPGGSSAAGIWVEQFAHDWGLHVQGK